jgi:hypothetical protein
MGQTRHALRLRAGKLYDMRHIPLRVHHLIEPVVALPVAPMLSGSSGCGRATKRRERSHKHGGTRRNRNMYCRRQGVGSKSCAAAERGALEGFEMTRMSTGWHDTWTTRASPPSLLSTCLMANCLLWIAHISLRAQR